MTTRWQNLAHCTFKAKIKCSYFFFFVATNYTTSSHKQSFFHVDCYFVAVLPDMVTLFCAIASQCGFSHSRALRDDIHPLTTFVTRLNGPFILLATYQLIVFFPLFFFIESRQGANGAFWITRRRRTAPARLVSRSKTAA